MRLLGWLLIAVAAPAVTSASISDAALDALADAGHWKRAKAAAESRLTSNAKDGVALWILSRVSEASRDLDGAQGHAEQAVVVNSQSADFHAQLAAVYGEQAQSAGLFSRARLAWKCRSEAETAARLDPKNVQSRIVLLEFFYQAPGLLGGDKKKAHALAGEIGRINPADGFLAQARLARYEQKPELLEGLYQKAVAADATHHEAHMSLARLYTSNEHKKYDRAAALARKAIQLDPGRASAYSLLAVLLAYQNEIDDLDALLAQAEKDCPDNLSPYLLGGQQLTSEGKDLQRGERYIRRYLSRDPEIGETPPAAAHYLLGQNLQRQEKSQDAVGECQTALDLKPDFEEAKGCLALAYAKQGRYTESEKLWKETLEVRRRVLGSDHPDTYGVVYDLACVAALQGNHRQALGWLAQAVDHGFKNADHMVKDDDLISLRGDPEFEALVARARENATKSK